MHLRLPVLLCFGLWLSPSAQAARPMVTDDARIVDDKSCQLESWVKTRRDSEEYWALPSCNFSGNLELALGGASTRANGESRTSDVVLQGKTLFKTLEPNGWAWGLTAGIAHHPDLAREMIGDIYAYIPASFSFRDDKVVLHTNLGWARTQDKHHDAMLWGLGSEVEMTSRTWLIAEIYGENQGNPYYQIGLRHWVVPNRVQVDATYGNRNNGGDNWISIGLRLLSPAFLP
ncbi:MAG: hypothetical protein KGL40_03930 [Rhodocyclaceae bacterium]|nr:hypothetical protein [Rhodocyclaceae bacterium]